MPEIDEAKELEAVNRAYGVLNKFLSDETQEEGLTQRQNARIMVSQTLINNHQRRLLAKARVASTYVGIAQTVLVDPEEKKKYLAITVPGFVQSLPEAQRPEELREIDHLKHELDAVKIINNNLLVKLDERQKENDELRFQLKNEQEKK